MLAERVGPLSVPTRASARACVIVRYRHAAELSVRPSDVRARARDSCNVRVASAHVSVHTSVIERETEEREGEREGSRVVNEGRW